MFIVYILLLSNGDLYKGYTTDLPTRYQQHQEGKVESTKNFRPLQLIHYETYLEESDARRRERFLKTTEGRRLLKRQIRDLLEKIQKK